jgi:sugar phosphate isomerase/epimerase
MNWRYAICNEGFEGWTLGRVAAIVAEVGYDGLELAPFTLCDDVRQVQPGEREAIRHTIEATGLQVVGLHWLLARTEGLQLNDPEPAVRERTAQYLLALIDFCADLGGQVLVFGSPQQRSLRPGWARGDAMVSAAEVFRRCGERAVQRGVTFCLEPLTDLETDFITSAGEAAEMVRRVDHPGFQMMVDVRAVSYEGQPVAAIIRQVAAHIRHVHLNDPNRLGPGMGEVDFEPILRTLRDVGYEGWLSVEPFDFSPGPEWIARESLAYLRQVESCQQSAFCGQPSTSESRLAADS